VNFADLNGDGNIDTVCVFHHLVRFPCTLGRARGAFLRDSSGAALQAVSPDSSQQPAPRKILTGDGSVDLVNLDTTLNVVGF